MAVHAFTGVTGKITVSGSIVGFVSGDFSLASTTGKYVVLGSNYAAANTRGLRSVSGSLKKAWGVADDQLFNWFTTDTELEIIFDADAAGNHSYTLTGCVLTDFSVEGLEAGSEGALMINASFEGLTWAGHTD
tara:strand:+ start:6917 stop:7315 length:399 start_codon:yes stop_codon:yes gene_type:complete